MEIGRASEIEDDDFFLKFHEKEDVGIVTLQACLESLS